MRQPLIDADVVLYETGFAVETAWGENEGVPPFEWAAEHFDNLIANICVMAEATHPPILFLTGKTNFRFDVAKRTPYKERVGKKPHHYSNLKAYIKGKYDYRISEGCEADDELAMEQTARPNDVIVCSRDKDVRQVAGWHYGWECGNQPSFGPELVDELGHISLNSKGKLKGVGELFFYAQCIMGDPVDSIPGLPKYGDAKAFKILDGSVSVADAYNRVLEAYKGVYGDDGEKEMLEQATLLYMVRIRNPDGSLKMWEEPDGSKQGVDTSEA